MAVKGRETGMDMQSPVRHVTYRQASTTKNCAEPPHQSEAVWVNLQKYRTPSNSRGFTFPHIGGGVTEQLDADYRGSVVKIRSNA